MINPAALAEEDEELWDDERVVAWVRELEKLPYLEDRSSLPEKELIHTHEDSRSLIYAGYSIAAPGYHLWVCGKNPDSCRVTEITPCGVVFSRGTECNTCEAVGYEWR